VDTEVSDARQDRLDDVLQANTLPSVLVKVEGASGRHDNFGSALAAHPGWSQGRPDNDLELAAHVSSTACPHLRAPGAPRPGTAQLSRQSRPQECTADIMPDNAFIESFIGKFRAECLNQHWFLTLDDARQKMEEWRIDYNEVRPHSAIGNKPPISLLNASGASGPP